MYYKTLRTSPQSHFYWRHLLYHEWWKANEQMTKKKTYDATFIEIIFSIFSLFYYTLVTILGRFASYDFYLCRRASSCCGEGPLEQLSDGQKYSTCQYNICCRGLEKKWIPIQNIALAVCVKSNKQRQVRT